MSAPSPQSSSKPAKTVTRSQPQTSSYPQPQPQYQREEIYDRRGYDDDQNSRKTDDFDSEKEPTEPLSFGEWVAIGVGLGIVGSIIAAPAISRFSFEAFDSILIGGGGGGGGGGGICGGLPPSFCDDRPFRQFADAPQFPGWFMANYHLGIFFGYCLLWLLLLARLPFAVDWYDLSRVRRFVRINIPLVAMLLVLGNLHPNYMNIFSAIFKDSRLWLSITSLAWSLIFIGAYTFFSPKRFSERFRDKMFYSDLHQDFEDSDDIRAVNLEKPFARYFLVVAAVMIFICQTLLIAPHVPGAIAVVDVNWQPECLLILPCDP